MLSRSSEYAVRAMVTIGVRGADRPMPAREIAEWTGIPRNYLSKILGEMVRAGLLTAARGRGGGFKLRRDAKRIFLYDIVEALRDFGDRPRCLLGRKVCSDETACAAHGSRRDVWRSFEAYLKKTTLMMLAQADDPRDAIGKRRPMGKRSPRAGSRPIKR